MIHLLLGLTLLVGTIISFQAHELILYYGAYFGICLLALNSMKYGKDFFKSFSYTEYLKDKKVIVAGEHISTQKEKDQQEDRFLNIFATERIIKRRVFTWLLFFAGLWFFQYKLGIEFSLETIAPLFICIVIVNSFYAGHFLVALLLNLVVVLYRYTGEVHPVFYLTYSMLFLVCLFLIGTGRENLTLKKVARIFILAVALMGVTFGISTVLPDQEHIEKQAPMDVESVQSIKEKLSKMKVDLGNIKLKIPEKNMAGLQDRIRMFESMLDGKHTVSERESLNKQLKSITEDFGNLKTEFQAKVDLEGKWPGFSPEDLETLSKFKDRSKRASNLDQASEDLKQLGKALEDVQMNISAGNLSAEEYARLEKTANKLSEDINLIKDPKAISEIEKEAFNRMLTKLPEDQASQFKSQVSSGAISPEDKENLIQTLENFQADKNSEKKTELAFSEKDETELLQQMEKERKESGDKFQFLNKILPMFLAGLVVLFITYLLRKKGIKKIITQDEQVIQELKDEWKKLKKLKLSPREEVIHYYNLYHESIQKIHYESHETPPSCIVYEDMKEFQPVLEKSTKVLTEVFAQCYYGDKEVSGDSLKYFRKAISIILKVYQLN